MAASLRCDSTGTNSAPAERRVFKAWRNAALWHMASASPAPTYWWANPMRQPANDWTEVKVLLFSTTGTSTIKGPSGSMPLKALSDNAGSRTVFISGPGTSSLGTGGGSLPDVQKREAQPRTQYRVCLGSRSYCRKTSTAQCSLRMTMGRALWGKACMGANISYTFRPS